MCSDLDKDSVVDGFEVHNICCCRSRPWQNSDHIIFLDQDMQLSFHLYVSGTKPKLVVDDCVTRLQCEFSCLLPGPAVSHSDNITCTQ